MTRTPILQTSMLAALAAGAFLAAPAPVRAYDSTTAACVTACSSGARDCEAAIREATQACIEDAGCAPLLDAARSACTADKESDECAAARDAAKACVDPCRTDDKDGRDGCRAARVTCLTDECGLSEATAQCGRFRGGHDGGNRP